MASTQNETMTVEVKKLINAPVENLFKAWTEADQMVKWMGGNMVASVRVEQDFRVGGQYRFDTTKPDGQTGVTTGTYREIIPNKKLVYSWTNDYAAAPATDTLVTVEFVSKGESTEIVVKHTNFATPQSATGHTMGWQASLEKLAQTVA